ncbi:MAG: Mobile element protein, partial [Olavius algarvensis Gamma 1 endosymbiont]
GEGGHSTMFSLNGCGAVSNTKTSTSRTTRASYS